MCFIEHHLAIVWGICSYSIPLNFKQALLNLTKGMIQADQKLNSVKGYFVKDLRAQAIQPKYKCICLKRSRRESRLFYSVCDTHLFYFVVTFKICSSSVLSPKQIQPNANAILFVTLTYSSQTDFAIQTNLGLAPCAKNIRTYFQLSYLLFSWFFLEELHLQ